MLNENCKVFGHGHRLDRTDIRAPSVARWHETEDRLGGCSDDSWDLAEVLTGAALAPAPKQHAPMDPYVLMC
jgi:hypothetical protein